MNERISSTHLERCAIVYVRQSSMTQLRNNHESRRMQYAMKGKLVDLGWPESRIEVIDDDLGITASGAKHRSGFEQLTGKVAMGQVGIVAARELSRFARNSADWQRLLELCRLSDTMLLDHEAVYDIRRPNDCLLLGIKSNISSYELELFRARGLAAIRERAARGVHIRALPVGFIKTRDHRVEKTPDTRVREAIELVFAKFRELGSACKVTAWFQEAGLLLPVQYHGREVQWMPVRKGRVMHFFTNPCYAGVYAFGRKHVVRKVLNGRTYESWRISRNPKEWAVCIEKHHEGYITLAEFKKIGHMLNDNKQRHAAARGAGGAAKNGLGLFSGLLRCGRCGRLLNIYYSSRSDSMRYSCYRGEGSGAPPCGFHLNGDQVDPLLEEAVLSALAPSAVAAAEQAWCQYGEKVDGRERALKRECEQATYEAERARRQYDAIEPENRMVAAELERRWNQTLTHAAEAKARLDEYRQSVSHEQRTHDDFMALAASFTAVWRSPGTELSLKKRIVRTIIEEVAVAETPGTDEICLRVHWRGGSHSEHRFFRRSKKHTHIPENIQEALYELSRMCDDQMIAKYFTENGSVNGRSQPWTGERVAQARRERRILGYNPVRREEEGLLTLNEAARFVGVSHDALQALAKRGEVAHKHPLPIGPYIFRRADLEGQHGDRIRKIVQMRRKVKSSVSDEQGRLFDSL